jgi:hypothetical protein
LILLIVNYIVDLMICVILVLCVAYFRDSPSGEAAKTGSSKKTLIFIS